jgi:hypothetical protein
MIHNKPMRSFRTWNDFGTVNAKSAITTGRSSWNDFETITAMRGAFMPLIVSFRSNVCIGLERNGTLKNTKGGQPVDTVIKCSSCRQLLQAEAFNVDRRTRRGRTAYCKACLKVHRRRLLERRRANDRARRHRMRTRKHAGLIPLRITARKAPLVDFLIDRGLLAEWSENDKQAIAAALEKGLALWTMSD